MEDSCWRKGMGGGARTLAWVWAGLSRKGLYVRPNLGQCAVVYTARLSRWVGPTGVQIIRGGRVPERVEVEVVDGGGRVCRICRGGRYYELGGVDKVDEKHPRLRASDGDVDGRVRRRWYVAPLSDQSIEGGAVGRRWQIQTMFPSWLTKHQQDGTGKSTS